MPLRLSARPWATNHPSAYRGRFALLAALAVVAPVSLSGCASLTSSEPTVSTAQLKQELLTPPPGATPWPSGTLAPGGVLNLDQFVDGHFSDSQRGSEKSDLTQDGFEHAVETNWNVKDQSVDVFLIQFQLGSGAEDFVSSTSTGTSQQEAPMEPLTSIPGVSGGEAWSGGLMDKDGYLPEIGWFAVGNVAVDIHYSSPVSDPAALYALARAQLVRVRDHASKPSPLPAVTGQPMPSQAVDDATDTQTDKTRLLHDLVTPPSGSQPWAVDSDNGPVGILNIQQAGNRIANDPGTFTAEEHDRGFQYAVRENWKGGDGSQADVYLLQYAQPVGAQSFVLEYQAGDGDSVGTTGTYHVPNSGGAMAFEHPHLTSDGFIWTDGYFEIGNIAVVIDYWHPATPDRAAFTALMQQQYQALTADRTVSTEAREAPPLPTATS